MKRKSIARRPFDTRARELFRAWSQRVSTAAGSPWTSLLATSAVILWLVTGPFFHFSENWQLVIATGTSIITFLMVFLIQSTQNRHNKTIQLKLDELLRGVEGARTHLVNLETLSDTELEKLQTEFQRLRKQKTPSDATGA